MVTISFLKNPVQGYGWGSETAIQGLLGLPEAVGKPMAELWMGAHPRAPSEVFKDGEWRSLEEIVEAAPESVLGQAVAGAFSGRLPFLFKVLAASGPLSIQVHPDSDQAGEGFAAENRLGIPLDAPHRNYRDAGHKPEILCALTPFFGLMGFRGTGEIIRLTETLFPGGLASELAALKTRPRAEGLRHFCGSLMRMDPERRKRLVREGGDRARKRAGEGAHFYWIDRLARVYPDDIAILSPLFLNPVKLEPGEALFIPAGELHAYLEGVGLELMANSDNVLRGGLTRKHVDAEEVLRVVNFEGTPARRVSPVAGEAGEKIYPAPAAEFLLSAITVTQRTPHTSPGRRSVEILLCTEGEVDVTDLGSGGCLRVARGASIIVPAAVARYRLEGDGTLYRASVPI